MRGKYRLALIVVATCGLACAASGAPAMALPAERHYEMVSPPFKNGYGAVPIFTEVLPALDGESVEFSSDGTFAGAPAGFSGTNVDYVARRGPSEWGTQPVTPPSSVVAAPLAGDVTPTLSRVLVVGTQGPSKTYAEVVDEQDVFTHPVGGADIASEWEQDATVAPVGIVQERIVPFYSASDRELCHVVLLAVTGEPLVAEADGTQGKNAYELNLGCHGEPRSTELVALNNEAKGKLMNPDCASEPDGGNYQRAHEYRRAVNSDGSEVFFTTSVTTCIAGTGEAKVELPHQLFVRLAGARTLEVSRPIDETCKVGVVVGEVPCDGAEQRASADFQGASEDGSRVYFSAPLAKGQGALVPGDEDASNNLYLAAIGCPASKPGCGADERAVTSLVEASHDPRPGQEADVMGVVRVAQDGARAYFVAGGDLLTVSQQQALELEGSPLPRVGAANLYAYDAATGGVAFVADLCTGTDRSGASEDFNCPTAESDQQLWLREGGEAGEAQTGASDGRFLVFATYGQLSAGDVNDASDVYRYDAVTGRLQRVSLGEDGFDDNGNRTVLDEHGKPLGAMLSPTHQGGRNWEQYEMSSRAISEDGSRVVFLSAEPLSAAATNGLQNVYEWRESGSGGEGSASLISSGSSEEGSGEPIISPSGRDIFFFTSQGLLPQDADGLRDIYDARTGPGFPASPASPQACRGDACQGPLTEPSALLVPASATQTPGENLAPTKPPSRRPKKKPAPKKKKPASKCRRSAGKRGCAKRADRRKAKQATDRRGK